MKNLGADDVGKCRDCRDPRRLPQVIRVSGANYPCFVRYFRSPSLQSELPEYKDFALSIYIVRVSVCIMEDFYHRTPCRRLTMLTGEVAGVN